MLDDHAHVMQVKLCKANTRGVTQGKMERSTASFSGRTSQLRRGAAMETVVEKRPMALT